MMPAWRGRGGPPLGGPFCSPTPAIPLPQCHCRNPTLAILLSQFHGHDFYTAVSMPPIQCRGFNIGVSMPRFACHDFNVMDRPAAGPSAPWSGRRIGPDMLPMIQSAAPITTNSKPGGEESAIVRSPKQGVFAVCPSPWILPCV